LCIAQVILSVVDDFLCFLMNVVDSFILVDLCFFQLERCFTHFFLSLLNLLSLRLAAKGDDAQQSEQKRCLKLHGSLLSCASVTTGVKVIQSVAEVFRSTARVGNSANSLSINIHVDPFVRTVNIDVDTRRFNVKNILVLIAAGQTAAGTAGSQQRGPRVAAAFDRSPLSTRSPPLTGNQPPG
jgi:hypothetical protein